MVAQAPDDSPTAFGSFFLETPQKIVRLFGLGPSVDHVAHLNQCVLFSRPLHIVVGDPGVSQDLLQGRQFAVYVADRDCS